MHGAIEGAAIVENNNAVANTENIAKCLLFINAIYFRSGEDIENVIIANLEDFNLGDDVDFKKVGVTDQQRIEYDLPISLDVKVKAKLDRDTRKDSFTRRRRGVEAYQVEVDALPTIRPDGFKNLILRPIDNWFKNNIHKKVMSKQIHSEPKLRKLQKEKLTKLYNEIIKK